MPGPALPAVSMIIGGLQHTLDGELAAERRECDLVNRPDHSHLGARRWRGRSLAHTASVERIANSFFLRSAEAVCAANANYIITLSP